MHTCDKETLVYLESTNRQNRTCSVLQKEEEEESIRNLKPVAIALPLSGRPPGKPPPPLPYGQTDSKPPPTTTATPKVRAEAANGVREAEAEANHDVVMDDDGFRRYLASNPSMTLATGTRLDGGEVRPNTLQSKIVFHVSVLPLAS